MPLDRLSSCIGRSTRQNRSFSCSSGDGSYSLGDGTDRHLKTGLGISYPSRILSLVACFAICVPTAAPLRADEPAETFLKQLRAAGYHDMAVKYLARLDSYPGVDPELLKAVELEKGQTYIAAALASRNDAERDASFAKAAEALKKFVDGGEHPRTSEARLLLGTIQMSRAQQLMIGDPSDEDRLAARKSYLDAAETFDSITENLRAKLKEMRGQRIDAAKEPEKVARRDSYRNDFLNAQLNSGNARYLAARTYDELAEEAKPLLQKALEILTVLTDDYQKFSQGVNALMYRGKVQQALNQNDQALDSYLRMLEQRDAPPIRESKFDAAAGLIEVRLSEQPPRYGPAIERGQALIETLRPNERDLPAVQRLRVSLAKAYLARVADEENTTAAERRSAKTSSRRLLTAAKKVAGDHLSETQELLANIGIEEVEVELPDAEDPKSLQEANESTRQLLERLSELKQSLDLLERETDQSPEFEKQIANIKKQLKEIRGTGTFILRRGVALINANSDRELAEQARKRLAYLLYEQGRYREAAVVGSFIARQNPGTDTGLDFGLMALNSLRSLVAESSDTVAEGLLPHIERLGTYLSEYWPNDPQAAAARGVMVQLALSQDRQEQAVKLIEAMPNGADKAHYQRLIGMRLWNGSLQARRDGDEKAAENLLDESIQDLRAGLEEIGDGDADAAVLQAALVLSKAQLRRGDAGKALETLSDPTYGPKTHVNNVKGLAEGFAADVYSTELRAIVGSMTAADGDVSGLIGRAEQAMEDLRESVTGADAEARLLGTMVGLARDIREQVDAASPGQQQKLLDAFRIVVDRIAESSQDSATLQWVGNTLLEMGVTLMAPTDREAQGRAAELISSASKAFKELLSGSEEEQLAARYQLGRAYRLLGQYKLALDELERVLREKPNMLNAQIEAATAYENWAAELSPKYKGRAYEAALRGGRPDAEGKEVIWGWGKISGLTSRDPKFRPVFFDARYHVALSRFLQGRATDEKKVMEQAVKDITSVAALYPELGGPEQRQKFDRLLKTIQKELGRDPVGLATSPSS